MAGDRISIKKKIGILYWDIRRKQDEFNCKCKKIYWALADCISGFFIRMPINYKNIKKADCLIICAHPDDETIFFYSVIKELNPYVICMSNKGNKIRRAEFENALKHYGIDGVMLNFPDTFYFKWKYVRSFLEKKLKKIRRSLPDIDIIYTHNNIGESEHKHHFVVSNTVQKIFYDKQVYLTSSEQIKTNIVDNYEDKEYVMKQIYKSQYNVLNRWCSWFEHYMKYEYFEKARKDYDKHNNSSF